MDMITILGIIGLFVGIAFLIIGAYKGLGAIPLTIFSALLVIIFNYMPIWDTLTDTYAAGFAGVVSSYFFLFVCSSVYAKFMEDTGAASAIGYKLVDTFGVKYVSLISILIGVILTYGGVSFFVYIFAAAPIMFSIYKEADLPVTIMGCACGVGASTFTLAVMPGTTQLTNVIPTQYLGTTLMAAPILGIVMSIAIFILGYIYTIHQEKLARKNHEHWTDPVDSPISIPEHVDRSQLPSAICSFAPIIIMLIIIIGGTYAFPDIDTTLLSSVAMIIASIVCYILNHKYDKTTVTSTLSKGSVNAITGMIGLAAVVAFGNVVSATDAFQSIVNWLMNLDMNVYWKGVVSTMIISGITGSSSGGLRLVCENLADYFISSGCNLAILHRLMTCAAITLDSLPHSSGIFLTFSVLGVTHKQCYKHVFMTCALIPLIVCIVSTIVVTLIL